MQILLEALVREAEATLSDCVRKAYEASLKAHHGMIVKGVFAAAVSHPWPQPPALALTLALSLALSLSPTLALALTLALTLALAQPKDR